MQSPALGRRAWDPLDAVARARLDRGDPLDAVALRQKFDHLLRSVKSGGVRAPLTPSLPLSSVHKPTTFFGTSSRGEGGSHWSAAPTGSPTRLALGESGSAGDSAGNRALPGPSLRVRPLDARLAALELRTL